MIFRNLELVRHIIKEASGLDVSYAYDDLVFAEHGIFIVQFDDNNTQSLNCYFQKDCTPVYREQMVNKLVSAAKTEKYSLVMCGDFTLTQQENNREIKIEFGI